MLFKILFGPILLLQGWWIRKKTPKLPEPNVLPVGVVGEGEKLRLLLLGDSSAAGIGADEPEQTLLAQLLKNLNIEYQVEYQMLAKTGRKTAEMLAVLAKEPNNEKDVVITALGVNDVTSQVPLKTWIGQQQDLIQAIKKKYQPKQIIMTGLPPMRDFPALSWPLNAFLGSTADEFDAALLKLCNTDTVVHFHSIRNYPATAQIASDGFHPGPSVYQIWAANLAAQINKPSES